MAVVSYFPDVCRDLIDFRYAIQRRSPNLDSEVSWRLSLALDVAGVHPRGPNPLPGPTWRPLAATLGARLIEIERARYVGAKLATAGRYALEAAAAIARTAELKALEIVHEGWELLDGLEPRDVLQPWALRGDETPPDGVAQVLALLEQPSEAVIQPREVARL